MSSFRTMTGHYISSISSFVKKMILKCNLQDSLKLYHSLDYYFVKSTVLGKLPLTQQVLNKVFKNDLCN